MFVCWTDSNHSLIRDMKIGRRAFLGIGLATVGLPRVTYAGKVRKNEWLSVFVSDIHLGTNGLKTAWGVEPTYQNVTFDGVVTKILGMNPRPAHVIVFGDLSVWFGYKSDYEAGLPCIRRLEQAGIDVVVTAGNHDHRTPLLECYPKQKKTPVKDRLVSVVDLGTADLILLDTLSENLKGNNWAGGAIDDVQWNWFVSEVASRKRPFFVGSHHPPTDLGGRDVRKLLTSNKNFVGWIHGHEHVWSKRWFLENWQLKRYCRVVGLPSLVNDDIGFAVMQTHKDGAVLKLEQSDFVFPEPVKSGAKRPAIWDCVVSENQSQCCNFTYD